MLLLPPPLQYISRPNCIVGECSSTICRLSMQAHAHSCGYSFPNSIQRRCVHFVEFKSSRNDGARKSFIREAVYINIASDRVSIRHDKLSDCYIHTSYHCLSPPQVFLMYYAGTTQQLGFFNMEGKVTVCQTRPPPPPP